MTGRHQPENGADSADARGPYLVTLEDRFDGWPRFTVQIPAAYGTNDARHQAEDEYPGMTVLKVVPVEMAQ